MPTLQSAILPTSTSTRTPEWDACFFFVDGTEEQLLRHVRSLAAAARLVTTALLRCCAACCSRR